MKKLFLNLTFLVCLQAIYGWALEPVGRSKAASIALAAFGGKVLSVDEVEKEAILDADQPPLSGDVHYEVKLLQPGGRVKVVHLDAVGNVLDN